MNPVPVCRAALLRRFRNGKRGSVAVIFAIAIVPILIGVGAAIDFPRANAFRNTLQAALDNALLGGAKDRSTSWTQIASNLFNSNVTTDGNTGSNNSQCSKFVFNSFTTNGSVDLQLQQQTNACAAIGLNQWNGIVVHLTQ
jgi:Flp pilus assembly protein TadG